MWVGIMSDEQMLRCEFQGEKLVVRLHFTIRADVRAISPVIEGVMKIVREMECAEGKDFEVETALRESLANAIKHGCHNDSSRQVECCVACDELRGMLIVVRDPGPGFDPASLPSPVHGQNLYAEHGRGIYLINQLMDEVEVKHERGGTRFTCANTRC
jgi:serine/threonine-protein kinase RsbW